MTLLRVGLLLIAVTAFDKTLAKLGVKADDLAPPQQPLQINAAKTHCSIGCSVTALPGDGLRIVPVAAAPVVVHIPAGPEPSWNLTKAAAVWLDLSNTGSKPVVVFATMDSEPWSDTAGVVAPGAVQTLVVPLFRKQLPPALIAQFPLMNGVPGGAMSLWTGAGGGAGSASLDKISELTLTLGSIGTAAQPVEVHALRWVPWDHAVGTVPSPLSTKVFPFIDKYGQSRLVDWPGKTLNDSDFAQRLIEEEADLAANPGPQGWSVFGGDATKQPLQATGHFRTQKIQDQWWLVDPLGYRFFSHGIDCVGGPGGTSTEPADRKRFFGPLPAGSGKKADFRTANLRIKYGENYANASATLAHRRLRSFGVNSIGNWANEDVFLQRGSTRTPYVIAVDYWWQGKPKSPTEFVDSPQFAPAVRAALQKWADKGVGEDEYLIGAFVDNELHSFNENETVAELYFSTIRTAMDEILPHKLYLGCRFDYHFWPNQGSHAAVKVAAKYADVISFNHYRYTAEQLAPVSGTDAPIIIGEYHFGALDRGPFHTGLRSVADQAQRAEVYKLFVRSALANPYVVGAHWFAWQDEPTTGRNDGENYQIGFVDTADNPYPEIVGAAREVGSELYVRPSSVL
jgi:hypothetical protein